MLKVQQGDSYAFEVIYDRYSKPLMNYFFRMLWKDREKSEDFMQDLFTKIVRKPELYNPKRPFKTWLYSVANNMCKNEYRKQEVRKNVHGGLHENVPVPDRERGGEEQMQQSMFNDALKDALENLDEKHRTTFILRFKQDFSIKEIADVCEVSEGTVKSRIFYTLKKLSAMLKEFDPKLMEVKNEG